MRKGEVEDCLHPSHAKYRIKDFQNLFLDKVRRDFRRRIISKRSCHIILFFFDLSHRFHRDRGRPGSFDAVPRRADSTVGKLDKCEQDGLESPTNGAPITVIDVISSVVKQLESGLVSCIMGQLINQPTGAFFEERRSK